VDQFRVRLSGRFSLVAVSALRSLQCWLSNKKRIRTVKILLHLSPAIQFWKTQLQLEYNSGKEGQKRCMISCSYELIALSSSGSIDEHCATFIA